MFKSNIGVDIGSSSIKVVQVGSGRKGKTITKLGEEPLPQGAVVSGEVRDTETVANALKQLWKREKFSGRLVTFSICGLQTVVREATLPWEPPKVFKEALPLRVGKDMPVDPSEMVLDYYPLDEKEIEKVFYQHALLVGALSIASENTTDALKNAKLHPRSADYAPFALIRAATYLDPDWNQVPGPMDPDQERKCQAIVDVGAQVTTVILHEQGRPLFMRSVNAGSNAVTNALADQLQTSFDTAELLKRQLGLGQIVEQSTEALIIEQMSESSKRMSQSVINAMAGSLVQVARESIVYYLTQSHRAHDLGSILLTGGGSLLSGYQQRLEAELRAPTTFLNPVEENSVSSLSEDSEFLDPKYGTAYGLAVRVGGK